MVIYFNNIVSFMLKSNVITKCPQQLSELQKLFFKEIKISQHKANPIILPFFNFVCYTVDLFTQYAKTPLDISFNLFLVDSHLRKYSNNVEVCRRFIGFVSSWKKYSQTDEAKLFLSFLRGGRNNKKSIKLFLKIRKVLLKNINQKVLQQINLSHEDTVTITHSLQIISTQQRKELMKKLNEYFISQNFKSVNNTKFNAAIICEYFMVELNDKSEENEKLNSSQSSKHCKAMKNHHEFIQKISQRTINQQELSFSSQSFAGQFQTCIKVFSNEYSSSASKESKENTSPIEQYESDSKKPLVNLQKCMKELFILKEKDLEIDNRFKKINKVREGVDQY